jgi:hypothetical protein
VCAVVCVCMHACDHVCVVHMLTHSGVVRYVALQWKREKGVVPIDEQAIQACFSDVLSAPWYACVSCVRLFRVSCVCDRAHAYRCETRLLRCYGQRVAKETVKRLDTSAIVVVRCQVRNVCVNMTYAHMTSSRAHSCRRATSPSSVR